LGFNLSKRILSPNFLLFKSYKHFNKGCQVTTYGLMKNCAFSSFLYKVTIQSSSCHCESSAASSGELSDFRPTFKTLLVISHKRTIQRKKVRLFWCWIFILFYFVGIKMGVWVFFWLIINNPFSIKFKEVIGERHYFLFFKERDTNVIVEC